MLSEKQLSAVDLFCGVGGLTCGLVKAGVPVKAGVDIDPHCEYPYTANNDATYIQQSVTDITADELNKCFGKSKYRLLAGCAPCQPFSTYSQGSDTSKDAKWRLLYEFTRLIEESSPELVTMENVPQLLRHSVFDDFISRLEELGYQVDYQVVNCADYGVPQSRNRLVLLASKLGPIKLIKATHPPKKHRTVKQAIESLPRIQAGKADLKDPLHTASSLSEINMKRMKQSKPGGTWRDWDEDLIAACHKKDSGKTYPGVYGRMEWDKPAPTMTTQYFGFGNGRFGHPKQNRAISLREGAIFQSFPKNYKFVQKGDPVYMSVIGRLVGNAVPVKLGQAIGKSIIQHINEHG